MSKKTKTYTASDLHELLKLRYTSPQYALFSEVRNQTGHGSRRDRYCDAMAMCLWPSMGIELHGFEIKVSYSDWKKELQDPTKSAEFIQYCDRWWIVAPKGIIPTGELPKNWGLLEPARTQLRVTKSAEPNKDKKQMTTLFMASLFRRAHENIEKELSQHVHKSSIQEEINKAYERGKKDTSYENVNTKRALDQLRKSVKAFEENSGVKIDAWSGGQIGNQVAAFTKMKANKQEFDRSLSDAKRLAERARQFADQMELAVSEVEGDGRYGTNKR